ncbi:porin family protein [Aquisalimonas sp. 2447]|nr:porin family protein [Aquisalimonas sp. 2447]
MRSTFLGILLLIFSMPATTDNLGRHAGGYFGGGGLIWSYVDESVEGSAEGLGGQLRGGYRFNPFFGFETRFSAGGSGTLEGIEVQLNRALQFLATLSIPASERLRFGGYAGLSAGELEFSSSGFTGREADTGVSFGSFFEYGDPDGWAFYGDLGILQWGSVQGTGYMVAGLSVGALYRF